MRQDGPPKHAGQLEDRSKQKAHHECPADPRHERAFWPDVNDAKDGGGRQQPQHGLHRASEEELLCKSRCEREKPELARRQRFDGLFERSVQRSTPRRSLDEEGRGRHDHDRQPEPQRKGEREPRAVRCGEPRRFE